jgi:hypothetical protein
MPELNCTKCGEVKPETEFHREVRNPLRNGKRTQCKSCDLLKNNKYRKANRDLVNKKRVQYNRAKKAFFPPDLFDERLAAQNGVCAICGAKDAGGRGAFHADHDHATETPRGVLCHRCNIALGHFRDNPEILQAAIEYLNKYSEVE